MEARDKIAAARVWLLKHKPFFGVLARGLRVEPSTATPALRLLPDDRMLFEASKVVSWPFASLCARLAHVSLHAALGAHPRRRQRDPARWNVAHDLAVEPLLGAAGLQSPGPTTDRSVPFLGHQASAENYYEHLPSDSRPYDDWCDLCEPQTETASPPDAMTSPLPQGDSGVKDDGEEQQPPSSNDAETDPLGMPPPSMLPEELSAEDRGRQLQWNMRLLAAYEEEQASGGKTFGANSGWVDEWLRATIEPPADWSATVQHSISSLKRTNRSYLRPSRRMSALVDASGSWPDTVAMPGRRIETAGRLVTVIDTSASITEDMLKRFLGAIAAVATAESIDDVRLIQADAEITSDTVVFASELLFAPVAISGRGGTDFSPTLTMLAEEAQREAEMFTVVYLTDLDGNFPSARVTRRLDVLWVTPTAVGHRPPFGRVLTLNSSAA